MPRFVTGLIALALVGLVCNVLGIGLRFGGSSFEQAIADGKPRQAPSSVLPIIGGNETTSVAALRGRVVVLNFWASWCGPCNAEADVLTRAQQRLAPSGGTVLGVTVNDAVENSLTFTRNHGINFPSMYDATGALAREYHVDGIPATFVIDARGRVVSVYRGEINDTFIDESLKAAYSQ
jgi:cytochrome c biogenesis protein CcmG, thiol:disulfide interchange protein DsbE